MKRRMLARTGVALVGMAVCLGLETARAELAIGDPLPMGDQALTNVDGKPTTVNAAKGAKGTVVVFWCNHCPFVKLWRQRLIDVAREYGPKGVGFIAVNSNDPAKFPGDSLEEMQKAAREFTYPFPYVVDEGSTLAKAYGGTRTPHVFMFGPTGKLAYVGAIDDNARKPESVKKRYLRNALDEVVAGKPVTTPTTKSFGCSIKWYE